MLCVDNTEFSRNGDFTPSRFGAQQDVIQTLCRTKIRMHAENNLGLLATGGKKPKLVNTLTSDTNKLLSGFAKLGHDGEENNFTVSLRTAHLALRRALERGESPRQCILSKADSKCPRRQPLFLPHNTACPKPTNKESSS